MDSGCSGSGHRNLCGAVNKVFTQGVAAFVANVIIIGILGTLLLVAYSKVGAKSGSLSKED